MFYFIIFCFILFLASLDYEKKLTVYSRNVAFYILFFFFWLIAGLRYETGVDWPGYTNYFIESEGIKSVLTNALNSHFYNEYEFGYVLLNSIIRTFTANVQWLFLVIAFATNLMLFVSIKRYSKYVFISLMIYFGTTYFILDMSGIRQCIALNIFLLSINYIHKNEFLKYLLAILVASLFHMTSLLLIPIYFILKIKIKSWLLLVIIVVGIIISILEIKWIIPILSELSRMLNIEAITNKLYHYSNRNDSRVFGLGFVINFLIFIFCIWKRKELEQNNMFNIFLNMYVVSLFFYYFTWELNEFSSRLRLYFSIGNIILFTYFMDIYYRKLNRLLVFVILISFSAFYGRSYLFNTNEGLAYNPYQNYIVHKVFGLKSTGNERLEKFVEITGK